MRIENGTYRKSAPACKVMLPRVLYVRELKISIFLAFISLIFCAACTRDAPEATPTPTLSELVPTPTDVLPITPTWTLLPFAFADANSIFEGICFESAYDAAGRVFVMRSAEALTALFDGSDNSQFCPRPVTRREFDFAPVDGIPTRAIAGLWSRGRGCDARHEVLSVDQDDTARTYIIRLRFVTEGSCDYELVRPFWIGINGMNDYDIRILVE